MIEIRTDSLQGLRELGPPDLVSLVKQPSKSKQVMRAERVSEPKGSRQANGVLRLAYIIM